MSYLIQVFNIRKSDIFLDSGNVACGYGSVEWKVNDTWRIRDLE